MAPHPGPVRVPAGSFPASGDEERARRLGRNRDTRLSQSPRYSAALRVGRGGAELSAAGVPFVGADALEHLAHRHLLWAVPGWRWIALSSASFSSQMPTTHLIKRPGDDRKLVAHPSASREVEVGRLAAKDDVQQARAFDQARHRGDFLQRLRRLDKGHVGAGRECGIGARDRLVKAGNGARVGARNDQEIAVAAGRRRQRGFLPASPREARSPCRRDGRISSESPGPRYGCRRPRCVSYSRTVRNTLSSLP